MPRQYSGFLDPIDGVLLRGWAVQTEAAEESALVDVYVDTRFVTRVRANLFRADLEREGLQDGFAAFVFEIPGEFRDGETHLADVRHAGTQISLVDSPLSFSLDANGRTALKEKRRWSARNLVFEAPPETDLADALRASRKLAILSTYHEAPAHLAYHDLLMKGLAAAGFTVLVVHAADTHRPALAGRDSPGRFSILKRNIGYDFGSYAVGVFAACDSLPLLDELLLTNDSVLPVAGSIPQLVERLRAGGTDAVSCTDSFEHEYHLQSYMLWFGRDICRSECLPRFMADYSFTSVKEDVIAEGEIGLSRKLMAEGFTLGALFPYAVVAAAWVDRFPLTVQQVRDLPGLPAEWPGPSYKKALLERLDLLMSIVLTGGPLNPSHFFWDTLIEEFGFPLVKRELVVKNPCNVPTYFKLGTYFPAGSDALAMLTQVRNLYGGQLMPPVSSVIQLTSLDRPGAQPSEAAHRAPRPSLRVFSQPEAT